MAFAYVSAGFDPFGEETCFVRRRGGASCGVSCGASARAGLWGHGFHGHGNRSRPPCNFSFGEQHARKFEVADTPEGYVLFFDASGFTRENIRVYFSEGRLYVRASKDEDAVVEKSWTLPKNVVLDGISAKLDDATQELTVLVPKVPEKPKAVFDVPIESGSPAAQVPQADLPGPSHRPDEPAEAPMEADGSWVEVEDAAVASARDKGKAPASGSVVQDAADKDEGSA